MLKGVANIWMPVQDIERAVDFYEDAFGLPVVKRGPVGRGRRQKRAS